MAVEKPFWKLKSLAQMSQEEWESLCDGCGKCCLVKLQDEDTDEVYYTSVACRYLDPEQCRCSAYAKRTDLVAACVRLTPDKVDEFFWLPSTCAYRLLSENRNLPKWHPLLSGSPESVHRSGCSVRGKIHSETHINADDLQDYIIRWIE